MKFVLILLVNAMIFESMDARHKRAVFDIIPIYERNKVRNMKLTKLGESKYNEFKEEMSNKTFLSNHKRRGNEQIRKAYHAWKEKHLQASGSNSAIFCSFSLSINFLVLINNANTTL